MTAENKIDSLQPLITVALPVFNGGIFLEQAVRSIVNQTWKNWELLIIDDGSTDGAIDRLPFLSDTRIFVIRDGLNKGLAARLNQAVLLANGKYFARMDHDDICYPERFFLQLEYLERYKEVDLLATKCIEMSEDGGLNEIRPFAKAHPIICRRPWLGFYMPHPSWMGRVEWFRRHFYKEPAPYCCEDQELLLRAYADSNYDALDCVLLAYRVRDHNPLSKLFRTYVAMLEMQLVYFVGKRQFFYAILSVFAFVARMLKYVLKNFLARIAG